MTDWELWAAANEVIRQHGADALEFAARRQAELIEDEDVAGANAWQLIILKVVELLREKPAPGEAVQ